MKHLDVFQENMSQVLHLLIIDFFFFLHLQKEMLLALANFIDTILKTQSILQFLHIHKVSRIYNL